MSHPWILAEQTHGFIRSQKWEVAVLPFGATEPHNLHLPYGTDTFESVEVASRACQAAAVSFGKNMTVYEDILELLHAA